MVVGFSSPMAAACCGHGYCSREVAAIAESGWQQSQGGEIAVRRGQQSQGGAIAQGGIALSQWEVGWWLHGGGLNLLW